MIFLRKYYLNIYLIHKDIIYTIKYFSKNFYKITKIYSIFISDFEDRLL